MRLRHVALLAVALVAAGCGSTQAGSGRAPDTPVPYSTPLEEYYLPKVNDVVEAAIYDEIARLQKEPIADWELQKAKNGARRNYINGLQSSLGRANMIGQYAVYYGDPNLINTRIDKVSAVTKEDVQRVANKYLVQTNRTVVITVPKAGGGRGMNPGTQQ